MQSSQETPEERPDPWPEDHESQARLILELDTASRRRLGLPNQEHFEPDPFRREQIVDLATDRLLARAANLDPPRRARGWYFTVVNHLLQSDEIPTHRTATLGFEPGVSPPDPDRERERDEARARDEARRVWLEAQVPALAKLLRKKQLAVLDGSLSEDSQKAAARRASMDISNFRKALKALGKKIGEKLEDGELPPPLWIGRGALAPRAPPTALPKSRGPTERLRRDVILSGWTSFPSDIQGIT